MNQTDLDNLAEFKPRMERLNYDELANLGIRLEIEIARGKEVGASMVYAAEKLRLVDMEIKERDSKKMGVEVMSRYLPDDSGLEIESVMIVATGPLLKFYAWRHLCPDDGNGPRHCLSEWLERSPKDESKCPRCGQVVKKSD